MEQNVAQLSLADKLWTWFETNKKQVAWGVVVLVIVAFFATFYIWRKGENEVKAGEALTQVETTVGQDASADAYLKLAGEYPGTSASRRAMLQAATAFFLQEKYAEAQAQFQRFTHEFPDSPFLPQALLGVASCLDAQGKTAEAMQAYNNLIKRFSGSHVTPQAEFALARILESQGSLEQAWGLFEKLARQLGLNSSLGSEAGMRAEELKVKLPATVTAPPPAVSAILNNSVTNKLMLTTNQP